MSLNLPVSILYKSISGRHRPVSYPDGPITARYRFIKNAGWAYINCDNKITDRIGCVSEPCMPYGRVRIRLSCQETIMSYKKEQSSVTTPDIPFTSITRLF